MTEQTRDSERPLYPTSQCPHVKCDAVVIEVRLGPKLERKLVDCEPTTWQDGARVRIATVQADLTAIVAYRVQHAGRAFGIARLYRLHDETCKGQRKRARTKATTS